MAALEELKKEKTKQGAETNTSTTENLNNSKVSALNKNDSGFSEITNNSLNVADNNVNYANNNGKVVQFEEVNEQIQKSLANLNTSPKMQIIPIIKNPNTKKHKKLTDVESLA